MFRHVSVKKITIAMPCIGALSVIMPILRYDEYDLMEIVKAKHSSPKEDVYDLYDNEEQVQLSVKTNTPRPKKPF